MTPERLHKTWHFAFNFLPELPLAAFGLRNLGLHSRLGGQIGGLSGFVS